MSEHRIIPLAWDSAGKEWVARCSCGWWCRAFMPEIVDRHELSHRRAADLGDEALQAEDAAIRAGKAPIYA